MTNATSIRVTTTPTRIPKTGVNCNGTGLSENKKNVFLKNYHFQTLNHQLIWVLVVLLSKRIVKQHKQKLVILGEQINFILILFLRVEKYLILFSSMVVDCNIIQLCCNLFEYLNVAY